MRWTARPTREEIFVVQSALWVAAFVLLGRLTGAIKEVALAWRFGVGPEIDAYVFVFNLVSWPVSVWLGVLAVVLVPLVGGASPDSWRQFRSELLGTALIVSALLLALMWLGLTLFLGAAPSQLSPDMLTRAISYAPALSLLAPIGILIGLFSTWIMTSGKQINTLLEGIPALVLAVAVLLPLPSPLIWGSLAGALLHLAVVASTPFQPVRIEPPRFRPTAPEWAAFRKGMLVMVAGQVLMSLTTIVDQFYAAGLGAGTLSSLSYANRILALLLGIGTVAVGRATLVGFSLAINSSGAAKIDASVGRWIGTMFAGGTAIAGVGWWLAPAAVAVIYQRGAFTGADAEFVASLLRIGLLQMPFHFSAIIVVSLLASRAQHQYIAIGAALSLLVKVGLNILLVPALGAEGLLWATAAMYLCSFATLAAFARLKD